MNSSSKHDLVSIGRALAMVSGAVVLVIGICFAVTLGQPAAHVGRGGVVESEGRFSHVLLAWLPTILGSGLAIGGGLWARPMLLVAAFILGFFWNLLGFYTLLLPLGTLNLVGLGEVGYLLAAMLLWWGDDGGEEP